MNHTHTGRLIVVEGIDGAGKTTLAELVGYQLSESGICFISKRSTAGDTQFARTQMRHLSEMLWQSGDARDLPPEFWISLQAAWFCALSESVIKPQLAAGKTVLVDGWTYKFIARLEVQGYAFDDLDRLLSSRLRPDKVIFLNVDVHEALLRKRPMRPTELGLHAGYLVLDDRAFIDYQSSISTCLSRYARRFEWEEIVIEKGQTVAASALLLKTKLMAIVKDG